MGVINSIDVSILDFIQNAIRCAFLDPIMLAFSYLGEAGAIWILIAILMLFYRKTRATGVMMLAAMAIGYLVGEIGIKNIVCRIRPCYVNLNIDMNIPAPSGYSFPSGHSSSGFAAALVLWERERGRRWMGISAYALAFFIAFSRLYNYVHYPSDVLCGIILGTLSAALVIFIFKKTGLDSKLSRGFQFKQ